MKKIFAFILASIMVLSLVPASAFAAITKYDCPDPHTLATVPSYTKIETVAPTCAKGGQPGYTIYECDKCGEQFLGDFVNAPKHTWVSTADSTHKDTAAKCSDGTSAKKWEKCSVCGEVGKTKCDKDGCDGKCGFGYNTYAPEHVLVVKTANGCATVYNCTVCKKDFYLDADGNPTQNHDDIGHDWKYVNATVRPYYDANGKPHNGTAVYKCEDCKETKEVEILCEHECVFERVSGYVAPTCTTAGKYAEYQCFQCLEIEYYKETFDDDGNLTGKVDLTKEEAEELEERGVNYIPTIPHSLETETKVPGQCVVTGKCTVCKQQTSNVVDHINLVKQEVLAPTCTTIGYAAVACSWCQYSDIVIVPAINHSVAGTSVTIEVPVATANCATKSKVLVLCPLPDCTSTVQYNGSNKYLYDGTVYTIAAIKEGSYDKTNHKIVEQVINEGSCTVNRIVISYCEYGCAEYQYGVRIEDATGHILYTTETYTCSAVGYLKTTTTLCKVCGATTSTQPTAVNFVSTFNTLDEAKLFHGLKTKVTTPTFKDDGSFKEYKVEYVDTTATHTLVKDESKSFASTCTRIGYTTYMCTGCGASFIVIDPVKKHEPTAAGLQGYKAPTCDKEGNTGYYTCKNCGAYYVEDAKGNQTVKTTAKGNVLYKHSHNLQKVEVKDCTGKLVLTYWKCKSHKKYFSDAAAKNEISKPADVSHQWKTLLPGVTVTCDTDGTAEVKFCTVCNILVAVGKIDIVDTKLGTDATEELKAVIALADEVYVKEENVTFFEKDGVKYISYIENGDTDATIKELTTKKLNHETFVKEVESHTAHNSDCTYTDPLYIYEECELCGDEWLRSFTDSHRHLNAKGEYLATDCNGEGIDDNVCVICGLEIEVINHNPANSKNTLETVEVKATCVAEGYTYVYCTECGYKKVTGTLAKNKNNHAAPVGQETNYAQTGYKSGKRPCSACGYKGEAAKMKDKGLELLLSTEINGVEGVKSATYGSTIKVTVSLASLNGVNVWGLDFGFKYNPAILDYVGFEFNQDSAFQSRLATEVFTEYFNRTTQKLETIPAGIISVVAHADNEHVAIKGSQDLVTLIFEVKYAEDQYYGDGFEFSVGDVSDCLDYKAYSVNVIDENGTALDKVIYNASNVNSATVEYAPCCDLKKPEGIEISDILAIYSLILFGDYDVAADLNADGVVNAEDLRLSYAFLTGANSFEKEYGFPVEEEEVGGGISGTPRN